MIADPHELFFLRTLDDVERLRDRMPSARRAVVIGGGLLGVETAAALCQAGLKVTVVEMGAHLMRRQLDPATAEVLRRMLVARGVDVVTGHTLSTVAAGPDGQAGDPERRGGAAGRPGGGGHRGAAPRPAGRGGPGPPRARAAT